MARAQFRKFLREAFVNLPIGARFPGRVHRLRQRMDERVHVGSVEVVLLVPGRGRQHHVGIQAGGAHAEVERHQEVELALGRFVVPDDFLGLFAAFFAEVFAEHAIARAEQMLEEVLMPFARRPQQIGAPDEHVAREVVGMVGVFATQAQAAVLEGLRNIVLGLEPSRLRRAANLERIALQLRCRRQPAHALGAHVVIDEAAAEIGFVGERREDFIDRELFVAPLIGVRIKEARGIHVARRAPPIERERERRPAGLRTQFFLAHVMRPAAARFADAATQNEQIDDPTVIHVHVVPMVHRSADDDHRLALGLVCVIGKLARERDHVFGLHAGDLLLPFRGVGQVLRIIGCAIVAAPCGVDKAAAHAVIGHHQIKHRGHARDAIRQ